MNKKKLLKESNDFIESYLNKTFSVMGDHFNHQETLIIVVDMVKGFAKKGALYSPRVEKLISKQKFFLEKMPHSDIVFLCDSHPKNAFEFNVFLPHCIENTEETEVVDDLKQFVASNIIYKNTTNGFLEVALQEIINKENYKNIVLLGCCTDLCVLQLGLSLKTYFHHISRNVSLYVPIDGVDTFHLDLTNHPGDFMQMMALKMMEDNGIILSKIGGPYDLVK